LKVAKNGDKGEGKGHLRERRLAGGGESLGERRGRPLFSRKRIYKKKENIGKKQNRNFSKKGSKPAWENFQLQSGDINKKRKERDRKKRGCMKVSVGGELREKRAQSSGLSMNVRPKGESSKVETEKKTFSTVFEKTRTGQKASRINQVGNPR